MRGKKGRGVLPGCTLVCSGQLVACILIWPSYLGLVRGAFTGVVYISGKGLRLPNKLHVTHCQILKN